MSSQRVTYVDDCLRKMRDALKEFALRGLTKSIYELEQEFAPVPNSSRILSNTEYREHALGLLAQIPKDVLDHILANTLPSAVHSGTITLPSWMKISPHKQPANQKDPGIYVNFLATYDGSSLTINEFERFLDGMRAAAYGTPMSDAANTDICQLVDTNYSSRTGRMGGFLKDIRNANLQKKVDTFIERNQNRLDEAKRVGATELTICGECGWSRNVHIRCQEHNNLDKASPDIFRLANCVLQSLFPTKRFRMHSFCLFKVFRWEQAELGESIGSQLVASYAKHGGFNFAQAGISIEAAKEMSGNEWIAAADRQQRLLELSYERLENEYTFWETMDQDCAIELDRLIVNEDLDAELQRKTKFTEDLKLELEETEETADEARRKSTKVKKADEKRLNGLRKLAAGLTAHLKKDSKSSDAASSGSSI